MSLAFVSQLGLKVQQTDIGIQKIDSTTLEIYRIMVSIFSVSDKDGRERVF